MTRRRSPARTPSRQEDAPAESENIVQALLRFFSYHSALPPDEFVRDFLYLIQPGRLLAIGQGWVRECARSDERGARAIAEVVHAAESAQAHYADRIALAAYALAKTGGVTRASARPTGERLVALLVSHCRALQLTAAVVQHDDAVHLVRLTTALVQGWPTADTEKGDGRATPTDPAPLLPAASRPARWFSAPIPTTGNAALDARFRALDSDGLPGVESRALLIALLCPDPPLRPFPVLRLGLPPLVRLKALGYDEQNRVGFAAELTVDRWEGQGDGTRLIRHPDSLFVVTDDDFEGAVALAARLSDNTDERRRPGQTLRWSLRRDSLPPDTAFFATGGSIAGAFAVAFRLIQERAAWLRPVLNWAVVSSLADSGALLGVDTSTLKAKIEAAGSERIILSVDQSAESAYLLRQRRRILTAASLDEAVRQCLRSLAFILLWQYRIGISVVLLTATVAAMAGTHITRLMHADQRTEFDASDEFSLTSNPAPYSPWQYGWLPAAAVPDPRTFIVFRRHKSWDGHPSLPNGLCEWSPPDSDGPVVCFSKNAADIAWPAALVVFPGRAIRIEPDQTGNCACVRFVAPRDGTYRTAVTFWGVSIQNYGTTLYLFENNHLIDTRSSTAHSTIRRKNAVSFAVTRGDTRTIVDTKYLHQGQTIDLVVGLPVDDGTNKREHAAAFLCHISRLN